MEKTMATIEIPDELFSRVEQFTAVVSAVLNEDAGSAECLEIVIDRGLRSALGNILESQEESILVESFHQLAARNPALVYAYVADMIGLGFDIRRFYEPSHPIGFGPSTRSDV